MKTEKYIHHGVEVSVISELKGKHRQMCLCYACRFFKPGQPDNCDIAEANYAVCVKYNVVTPVWECPKYEPKT
jgi:hypothetical protein